MPHPWYLGAAWALVFAFVLSPVAALSEHAAVEGTDDNWDDVVMSSPLVLVGFFAPWCAHCKALKPHWAEVAAKFNSPEDESAHPSESHAEKLTVVSVDAVANPGLYWRYDLSSYPTLRLFRGGVALTDCGARTADDIIAWASARRAVAHSVPLLGVPNPEATSAAALQESVQGGAAALAASLENLRQSHTAPSGQGGSSWDLRVALVFVPADAESDSQQQAEQHGEAREAEAAFRSLAVLFHDRASQEGPQPGGNDAPEAPPLAIIGTGTASSSTTGDGHQEWHSSSLRVARTLLGVDSNARGPAVVLIRAFPGPDGLFPNATAAEAGAERESIADQLGSDVSTLDRKMGQWAKPTAARPFPHAEVLTGAALAALANQLPRPPGAATSRDGLVVVGLSHSGDSDGVNAGSALGGDQDGGSTDNTASSSSSSSSPLRVGPLVAGLRAWTDQHRYPAVLEWLPPHMPFIFTRRPGFETHVLLFLPPDDANSAGDTSDNATSQQVSASNNNEWKHALAAEAQARGNVALFLVVAANEDTQSLRQQLVGSVGVNQLPTVVAVRSDAKAGTVTFYRRLDPENIKESDELDALSSETELQGWIEDFFQGKVPGAASSPKPGVGAASQDKDEARGMNEAQVVADEKAVQVLTSEDDFDDFLAAHPLGLVEFYAPWCGHCKKLRPAYAAAAQQLKSWPVAFAKADATAEALKELAEMKLQVHGFPNVFATYRGSVLPFSIGRDASSILAGVAQLASAAAAQGDTTLVHNAELDQVAPAAAATKTHPLENAASAAVSRVASALAATTQASSRSDEGVEGLAVLLVEPTASLADDDVDGNSKNKNQGLAADVLSFQALALRIAGLGSDDAAVRDALGLPSLPTVGAVKDSATVVLSRVPSSSVASLIEVSHDSSTAQGWTLSGGGIPVGLPAAVEAAQRAMLVAVRVVLPGGKESTRTSTSGAGSAANQAASVAAASVSDLSSPGFLGGGEENEVGHGEEQQKHLFYASAELGSLRGLGWLKQACRPSVVAFGQSAAFNAIMQTPSVRQLLLFDTFVDPDDEAASSRDAKETTAATMAHAVSSLEPVLAPLLATPTVAKRAVVVLIDAQASEALTYFNLAESDLPCARFVEVQEQRSFLVPLPQVLGGLPLPKGTLAQLGSAGVAGSGGIGSSSTSTVASSVLTALSDALSLAFDQSANSLSAVRRSQPINEAQLNLPMQRIVGDQWQAFVLQRPSTHVLVVYYDPDCPHCKKMVPLLDALAEEAYANGTLYPRGPLALVALDGTANDPGGDNDWKSPDGVPAVHLYKAMEDSSSPARGPEDFVAYSGGPSLEQLRGFLEEQGLTSA